MAISNISGSSAISGSKESLAWDQKTNVGGYVALQTVIVGVTGTSSITFSNIPQNYNNLQIRVTAFCNSANYCGMWLRIDGDTAANYYRHALNGNGASNASGNGGGATSSSYMFSYAGALDPYTPTVGVIDFPDYTNQSKNKIVRSFLGTDKGTTTPNAGNGFEETSVVWANTYPITSITLTVDTNLYGQFSHFALYGVN